MSYVPPRRSDGTIQHRRRPLPWPKGRPFKILSIDGGGICGILPVSVLAELETRFLGNRSIAGNFDMIAGTSTGGIIALGLAHSLTARDIQRFYVERAGSFSQRQASSGGCNAACGAISATPTTAAPSSRSCSGSSATRRLERRLPAFASRASKESTASHGSTRRPTIRTTGKTASNAW
jgi:predicted acylesterase/phospholipase RssA